MESDENEHERPEEIVQSDDFRKPKFNGFEVWLG